MNGPGEAPEGDKPREECGIFGIYGPGLDVARLTYYGLYALQHRGQESAGIAVADGRKIYLQKDMGLVSEVFNHEKLNGFHGHLAIGHVRYSTTGTNNPLNAQPFVYHSSRGMLGLAHNGNLTNTAELRSLLYSAGSVFQSTTDSEIIVSLIAKYSQDSLVDAIRKSMADIKGAYSLLILTGKKLIGVRDPHGIRPLCLGRRGNAYILASESCALDTVGAELIRDVKPGEIIVIDENGLTSHMIFQNGRRAHCIFEYIYFARADSCMDGFNINKVRREMGRQLAREYPVEADMVIPVPDSGIAAARGFAAESGIPFEEGLMKNRYIGRTFIQPSQSIRDLGVRLKLNPIRDVLDGKRVVMVDDSIVRGTTSGKIVNMLRECGVKGVHFCISSPPVIRPCFYGIDISREDELIACRKPLRGIREFIGADGLHYLSLEGLLNVFGEERDNFCTGCFSGNYPVEIPKACEQDKFILE
ncbi:MAG: Amidophosphoribosyltransferase precursor [Pelotomaculum sp. PtaB.Bin013]|uniref:Amidophosphoribosyltransferase n=1 Tax=Pelotomaculum isophthalicicum JI TaxID=947010 RepID=A0A9X4H3S9_9FIRM|nr:amidophosphoribosyltransferase [Pelotomaculum isophthalicicum]MDF9406803.1 amidophosphoribosyltransferase [Pelotomaculum isophthalicicum JI]OPX83703.1 MAG: Amidophosphoribosyltransferase precursor [Pelotomaculum sp. PtaB.Bin013]